MCDSFPPTTKESEPTTLQQKTDEPEKITDLSNQSFLWHRNEDPETQGKLFILVSIKEAQPCSKVNKQRSVTRRWQISGETQQAHLLWLYGLSLAYLPGVEWDSFWKEHLWSTIRQRGHWEVGRNYSNISRFCGQLWRGVLPTMTLIPLGKRNSSFCGFIWKKKKQNTKRLVKVQGRLCFWSLPTSPQTHMLRCYSEPQHRKNPLSFF